MSSRQETVSSRRLRNGGASFRPQIAPCLRVESPHARRMLALLSSDERKAAAALAAALYIEVHVERAAPALCAPPE